MKFLLKNKIKVKKIVTVAGFNNLEFTDNMNLYKSFYVNDNLFDIKLYSLKGICIYSDNDLYVPQREAEKFANNILAKKMLVNDAGHFNGECKKFCYTEFSDLLKFV